MRQADVDEVWASAQVMPDMALRLSLNASGGNAQTAIIDGLPAAMLGVGLRCVEYGRPWMLSTSVVDRYPGLMLRHSPCIVAQWSATFPVLINFVDARNLRSIRWLDWLGFTFDPALPWGALGLPFHRFEKRRSL